MPKHPKTVADLMDKLLLEGPIYWKTGARIADEYRKARGFKTAITRGYLRAHARYRAETRGWRLEMDEDRGLLIRESE